MTTGQSDRRLHEDRYVRALEEVRDTLKAGGSFADTREFYRQTVDVKALRSRFGMTQQDFADAFGIAIGTLRNWEQGRRMPDGPAEILLKLIDARPDVAAAVFHKLPVDVPTDTNEAERAGSASVG